MHKVLVNRLVKLALEESDHLDMTIAVDWDVKHETKQTVNLKRAAFSMKLEPHN